MASTTRLLKILSGPHAGSEAALEPGTHSIGRASDCDIVLNDTSLAEHHFQLTLTADSIDLKLMESEHPVYVAAKKVESETTRLEPFQVVSIGTFCFAVGPAQETWPALVLPTAASKPTVPQSQHLSVQTGTRSEPQGSKLKVVEVKLKQLLQLWYRGSARQRAYLLAGCTLAGVGLSLLIVALFSRPIAVQSLESQRHSVEDLMKQYNVDATAEIVPKDGTRTLVIKGYSNTDGERDAFIKALGESGTVADTQIYSSERLVRAVSAILEQLLDEEKDSVKVVTVEGMPGKISLSGYVQEADEWQRVLKVIKSDVTGIRGLEVHVRTLADTVGVVTKMLQAEGLADKLSIQPLEGTIHLKAPKPLAEQDQQRWKKVFNLFQKRFGNQPRLVLDRQPKQEQKKSLEIDIAVQAISFGNTPYLVMPNGQRYTVGSSLENGYVVADINRRFVLLHKDGQSARYYFNKKE